MLGASQRMKIAYLLQCLTHKENLHDRAVVYPAASNLEDERTSRRSRVKRLALLMRGHFFYVGPREIFQAGSQNLQ